MVQFNLKKREVALKVVYYGPPLSGKTTNLHVLFERAEQSSRGRLVTLETRDDRTIYFDMLPVTIAASSGLRLSIKLYTVPGQPVHNATRRVVLRGVDGVVFVASSERSESQRNREAWANLRENLEANHLDLRDVACVIQFNKQDLPNTLSDGEIRAVEQYSGVPAFGALAIEGKGVVESLTALLLRLWDQLCARQGFDQRLGLSRDQFGAHIARLFGQDAKRYGRLRA